MRFKRGDKVVCVDDNNVTFAVKKGKEYEVEIQDTYVRLKGIDNGFYSRRFKLKDNGVDTQGNPQYLDNAMLKPFQRVKSKLGILYMVFHPGIRGQVMSYVMVTLFYLIFRSS